MIELATIFCGALSLALCAGSIYVVFLWGGRMVTHAADIEVEL